MGQQMLQEYINVALSDQDCLILSFFETQASIE